jgi:hypothetical protein
VLKWEAWRISRDPKSSILVVEGILGSTENARLLIDTGSAGHLVLSHLPWKQIFAQNPTRVTLDAYFGFRGIEVGLASVLSSLRLGRERFQMVPVMRSADPGFTHGRFDAYVGLGILSRYRVFIDGAGGRVFVRPRVGARSWPLSYNRLGAYFLPEKAVGGRIVAHVAKGSVAYRAGVRSGDRLVAVDGKVAEILLRSEGLGKLSARWRAPPGKRYRLKLERGAKEYDVEVELEEIFPGLDKFGLLLNERKNGEEGSRRREPAGVK